MFVSRFSFSHFRHLAVTIAIVDEANKDVYEVSFLFLEIYLHIHTHTHTTTYLIIFMIILF